MNDTTSPLVEEANAYYRELLRPAFEGGKFLVAGPVAVGLGGLARQLVALGADRPFLIAGSAGTGTVPGPDEAELRVLGLRGGDILIEHRNLHRALENLPADVQVAVEAWDPAGAARFLFADPLASHLPVAGRKPYGARPAAWARLEDKVQVDAFWDAAGVARAPSRVVLADHGALKASARALDRGSGTVWAADAREGLNGGGLGLRWVRPGDDGRASFESLSRIADRVRVMPFLEGIPASIHGVVFADTVAVFRPVEMVVLRPLTGDRLLYAGCATAFDPSAADRTAMRDFAHRVGAALRQTVGYRGPFGIDGILTEDGFRPTELNPRAGAALPRLAAGLAGLPLTALFLAIVAGETLDYRPELLERAVVESSDAHRTCGGWSVTPTEFTESDTLDVVRDGNEYREARTGEDPDATFQFGPGAVGGFVRFSVRRERVVAGPSAAPEVVRAFRFADRRLGTDFGEMTAARNVRS